MRVEGRTVADRMLEDRRLEDRRTYRLYTHYWYYYLLNSSCLRELLASSYHGKISKKVNVETDSYALH